jgi:CRP/FNR family transcriptional regulator, cyclic AMP receptor protein
MHTNLGELHNISEKDAAQLLVTESALGQLSYADARKVVRYMKPKRIKAGAALIREGEKTNNDFMMLILSGDVRVESQSASGVDEIIVTVMSAGSLVGELGMINNTARSASCIAATELAVAVLSRSSMKKLMADEAEVAARFLLAISSRLAEHLRETTQKLKKFVQLNAMLQNEVYVLMDSQGKSEQRSKPRLSRGEMPTEPMSLATQPAALFDAYVPSTRRTTSAKNAPRKA